MTVKFTLNGEPRQYDGDPSLPLLTYLRDVEDIISPKDGCAPQAACGCCVVQQDARAALSCVTPMSKLEGATIVTTEGLGEYRQQVYANAFVSNGGVQCGFCIPGIVMQGHVLLNRKPDPSREDIEKALTPNLCRCTGYKKIVDAISCAAEAIRKEEMVPEPHSNGRIGSRHPKYEAKDLVLGQHRYVDDIKIPGMVFGAIKFSDHPRAIIHNIDLTRAKQVAGVLRILTAEDVPGQRFQGLIRKDWPIYIAIGETTRYVGDALALVVAETDTIAREAVSQIDVEYEVLEPITEMDFALSEEASHIHEGGNQLSQSITKRGDFEEAKANSAYISEGVYQTQMIEHGFMEPECSIAYPNGERLEVLSQGQGVFEDRTQIASLLGLEESQVRVKLVSNGGAFGGKEDLACQGHAALAAYHMRMPVKVRMTRDESIAFHPKRHPIRMEYIIGCDEKGKFTFMRGRFFGDTGAYASVGMKVLERSAGHATGAYTFPVTDVVSTSVYTNNLPCGAMRGFGVNQTAFALEKLYR